MSMWWKCCFPVVLEFECCRSTKSRRMKIQCVFHEEGRLKVGLSYVCWATMKRAGSLTSARQQYFLHWSWRLWNTYNNIRKKRKSWILFFKKIRGGIIQQRVCRKFMFKCKMHSWYIGSMPFPSTHFFSRTFYVCVELHYGNEVVCNCIAPNK